MKPVKFTDETKFFEFVFVCSAFPFEPWDVSVDRLEDAIRRDAYELGQVCEMSPFMVLQAYKRHPMLCKTRWQAYEDWKREAEGKDEFEDVVTEFPFAVPEWTDEQEAKMKHDDTKAAYDDARKAVEMGALKSHIGNEVRYQRAMKLIDKRIAQTAKGYDAERRRAFYELTRVYPEMFYQAAKELLSQKKKRG